jgi:outer membrane protein TolC
MLRRELGSAAAALALAWGLAGAAARPAGAPPVEGPAAETDARLLQPLALQDCIAIALENNLELRAARLDEAAARTGIGEARGAFWPLVTVTGERTNLRWWGDNPDKNEHIRAGTANVTQILPLGTTLGLTYGVTHAKLSPDTKDDPLETWSFVTTQPLLRAGGWRAATAGVKGAGYDARISRTNLEGTRLSVVQQVKTAYYEVIRQAKLIEVNEKAIERDRQIVAQSQSKLDAGLGTKRDVLSAEILLEQDRGKLVDAQTAYQEALDTLARVLGLCVGVHRLQLADREASLDTVAVAESAWLEKALRDNPTVRAARIAVERTRLDMQVAGNARLPQLDLNFTYNSVNDPDVNEIRKDLNRWRVLTGNEPKDLDFTASKGWSTFLTVSYPIGNRSLGAAYRRARLVHEQSQRTREDAERQVTLDVRSAIRALRNSVERLGILQKNIEGARDKLEFASVNFQLGRASNLDVTDAQKDLLDAEIDYVNEVIDYRVQLATIEALVGGFE